MIYKKIICVLVILVAFKTQAQNRYFKQQVKVLTSKKFHGRGYTHNGMEKAAHHLAKQLRKMDLLPLEGTYLHAYDFPINVIEDVELEIDGKPLEYGKDFIIKPSSKSVEYNPTMENYIFNTDEFIQSFESREATRKFVTEDALNQQGKNIILPPLSTKIDSIKNYYKQWANTYESNNNINRAIFRFVSDSLTASLSQRQANVTEFIIKDKFYKEDLKFTNYRVKTELNKKFPFHNVIGKIEGINKDSVIVISAHYDHLGQVGKAIFPGASDNASGTAMVLDLAKYYKKNPPKYTMVFMFFGAEEAGIVGALKYVEKPLFPLNQIKFLVNLDIMGAGEDGIQVVNGTKYKKTFDALTAINNEKEYLKQVKIRGESCNSDHCPFDQKGVPSFFIYTLGGKGNYHNIYDTYQNLDFSYSPQVKGLLIDFINQL